MRVRRRDQNVRGWNARSLRDDFAGFVTDEAMDPEQVTNHERQPRIAVIEHQTSSVQVVVNVRGRRRRETAHDALAERRRNVAQSRAGFERLSLQSAGPESQDYKR